MALHLSFLASRGRLVDDGKRGSQNQSAALNETKNTIGVKLFPAIADMLICKIRQSGPSNTLQERMDLHLGINDIPDAFRGCPVHAGDKGAAVVAVWSSQVHGWRLGAMSGCPYGIGSVVVTFNRYPALVIALLWRTLGLLAAAYFDDNVLVNIAATSQAKQMLQRTFSALGTPPKESKSSPTQDHRAFLGPVIDLGSLQDEKGVFIIPKRSKSPTSDCGPPKSVGRWNHNSSKRQRHEKEAIGLGPTASDALAAWSWPSSTTCNTTELAACRISETRCVFIKES